MACREYSNRGGLKVSKNQGTQHIINIADRLCENAEKIRYGSVSAMLKIHDGLVVDVTHSTTESTREKEESK